MRIADYTGIDQSSETLAIVRHKRPDWTFLPAPALEVPAADMVLCLEVLIHQGSAERYRAIVAFLARKTRRTLIVSGFAIDSPSFATNSMVFFHEPLEESLRRSGRFGRIRLIGQHTSVAIYRCDVTDGWRSNLVPPEIHVP